MKQFSTLKTLFVAGVLGLTSWSWGQVTTFDYTGAMETYTVPVGVTSIQIEAYGAQGANNGSSTGGRGGYISGEITVTPGDVLNVYVGGQDGFNGGGAGGTGGSPAERNGVNGGGASDVRVGGDTFDDRVIVAGGGGGAGRSDCTNQDGGSGGYPGGTGGMASGDPFFDGGTGTALAGGDGGEGACTGDCSCSPGGGGGGGGDGGGGGGGYGPSYGGVIAAGGTGGACGEDGDPAGGGTDSEGHGGCFGIGGDGGNSGNGGGGGGGGGWFGGGAGGGNWAAGGGGGSSYVSEDVTELAFTNDTREGNGQVIITVLCEPLTVTVSDESICLGDSFTLDGSGTGTISWDGGVINGEPFTPETAGVFTYTASSDADGDCGYEVEIEVLELPEVVATADVTEICLGETVTFVGEGADSYDWDMGVEDGVPFTPEVGTATYTVTGTDEVSGCTNTSTIDVTVNDLPVVEANATDEEICLGESFTLTGSGATTYEWTPDGTVDGEAITPDVTGTTTYEVTGTDDNGCINTASIDITVYDAIEITFTTEDEMMGGDGSIDITVTGGNPAYSFDWDNDGTGDFDDDEDLTDISGGTYVVVVEDEAGCTATETIEVNSQLSIDNWNSNAVTIYPNPTADWVTIKMDGVFTFSLVSINGKVLSTHKAVDQKNIDLSGFADGVYFIEIQSDAGTQSLKLIKQ